MPAGPVPLPLGERAQGEPGRSGFSLLFEETLGAAVGGGAGSGSSSGMLTEAMFRGMGGKGGRGKPKGGFVKEREEMAAKALARALAERQ